MGGEGGVGSWGEGNIKHWNSLFSSLLAAPFNNTRTLQFKTQLTIAFVAEKKKKRTKWINIYHWQPTDVTFWTRWSEPFFPEMSAKMVDGREKQNCWLSSVRMLLKGTINHLHQNKEQVDQ